MTFIPLSWAIWGALATGMIGAVGGAILVGMLQSAKEADKTLARGANAQGSGDEEPMHHDEYVCGIPALKRCGNLIPQFNRYGRELVSLRCLRHEGHDGPCDWPLARREEN